MLLSRISIPPPPSPEPEDFFHSALSTIFTDDAVNSHGTPGSYVTYRSPRFGEIKLQIPIHPNEEDGRKLFAHYLWNAGVVAAEGIEQGSTADISDGVAADGVDWIAGNSCWDRRWFDVKNKRVLELGAGTGLPSIIASLCGAAQITVTDHPSSPSITMGAIDRNLTKNLTQQHIQASCGTPQTPPVSLPDDSNSSHSPTSTPSPHLVRGYAWGTSTFYLPNTYGKPAPVPESALTYDKIIIADCLWMPSQHINLIRTILRFLPEEGEQQKQQQQQQQQHQATGLTDIDSWPCALVIAGFHTGRKIVADFFNLATETQLEQSPPTSIRTNAKTQSKPEAPPISTSNEDSKEALINTIPLPPLTLLPAERQYTGKLSLTDIFEIDVNNNTRAWQSIREEEGKWEGKRWCVVGVLVRR